MICFRRLAPEGWSDHAKGWHCYLFRALRRAISYIILLSEVASKASRKYPNTQIACFNTVGCFALKLQLSLIMKSLIPAIRGFQRIFFRSFLSWGDVLSENPFWLIAALLLGIAFWHSTLARGPNPDLPMESWVYLQEIIHFYGRTIQASELVWFTQIG